MTPLMSAMMTGNANQFETELGSVSPQAIAELIPKAMSMSQPNFVATMLLRVDMKALADVESKNSIDVVNWALDNHHHGCLKAYFSRDESKPRINEAIWWTCFENRFEELEAIMSGTIKPTGDDCCSAIDAVLMNGGDRRYGDLLIDYVDLSLPMSSHPSIKSFVADCFEARRVKKQKERLFNRAGIDENDGSRKRTSL